MAVAETRAENETRGACSETTDKHMCELALTLADLCKTFKEKLEHCVSVSLL